MATTEDQMLPLRIIVDTTIPNPLPCVPYVPSAEEAEHRYYGLPSKPRFVARSSHDVWVMPTGIEAYIQPRELRRVGEHPLCASWESGINAIMHSYLVQNEVQYTSLDPVRIGLVGEATAPLIVWVGVNPGSLSADHGVEVAVDLRSILLANGIEDAHIEIRESVLTTSAKLYRPAPTSNPTANVREAFSTTLGITICSENTPHVQGTATLFFTTTSHPGKLFLLTAKHVLFPADEESNHYEYRPSGPRMNVMMLGTNGFNARIQDIEREIGGMQIDIEHFQDRLGFADEMGDEEAEAERQDVQPQLHKAEKAIEQLERLLADVRQDWADPKARVIGHVVFSPPLIISTGSGFTQDFAVVEVYTTKIDATNFVENAIDLGTDISVKTLTAWMHPHPANQPAFKYPRDRLLRFDGTLSIDDMLHPSPTDDDSRGDPTLVVLKRGSTSGLTVGCLNNVCSVLRKAFETKPDECSKEFVVLPRTSQSGAFSESGDSGAAVINGWGAVAGMLTGGGGASKVSDCTYVTPITFLLERLEEFGFFANILPKATDIHA